MTAPNFVEFIIASINLESFLNTFDIAEIVILISEILSAILTLRSKFNAKFLSTSDTLAKAFCFMENLLMEYVRQTAYYCGCVFGVIAILLGGRLVLSNPDPNNV